MSDCAWCGDGNGICDDCMRSVFGVDPATIYADREANTAGDTNHDELDEQKAVEV